MYSFTREDIDLEAIRARIARMSDSELLKYGQSAAWMAEATESLPRSSEPSSRTQIISPACYCPANT